METSKLKKFAQFARRSLLEQVTAKLKLVLADESPARRERPQAIKKLEEAVTDQGKEQVIERVAYIWFNRFCALRFMDVNRYNRIGIVSPAEGQFQPEILADAKMGHIDEEMVSESTRQKIFALLDGKTPSQDPQGEAYRLLVVAACNYWYSAMPFLFERIDDYTELLMPDDLLSGNSILAYTREAMTPDACEDVEVIGWLYQFYISEKKDQVFVDLKKNKKVTPENIPAATQLFTPHWIVRYLVENSLGRLWMLNRPDSGLIEQMDYYIKPAPAADGGEQPKTDFLRISGPEEIKICDPACGSGHMLTYAFDLLWAIYEEEGYEPADIPAKILTHNLYGIEIDERAGELAAFALSMKARAKLRRFFRTPVQPNICVLENLLFDEGELTEYMDFVGRDLFTEKLQTTLKQFEEAKNFGSLIRPEATGAEEIRRTLAVKNISGQLFLNETHQRVLQALLQADYLSPKYHVVIANPPYMGGKSMSGRLAAWLKDNYTDVRSDLFSAFIVRNTELALPKGQLGFMSPFVWMFISSYEKLRSFLINQKTITSLVQLEYSGFDGATVPICTFTAENAHHPQYKGGYVRLSDFRGSENQAPRALEAIQHPGCGWFYRASANEFNKIPGSPIAYWLSDNFLALYENPILKDVFDVKEGVGTRNDDVFMKMCWEVPGENIGRDKRWILTDKAGDFRKWYMGPDFLMDWEDDGYRIKNYRNPDGSLRSRPQNLSYLFKEAVAWGLIGSGITSFRWRPEGYGFVSAAPSLFGNNVFKTINQMNSKIVRELLKVRGATLNVTSGVVSELPFLKLEKAFSEKADFIANRAVDLTKQDWDSFEPAWDFTSQPMLMPDCHKQPLEATYQKLRAHWQEIALEMQRLEEDNNRIFIDAYGLQDELTPDVPLEEITLTCNPYYRYGNNKSEEELEALLLADTMRELVSYAVGCMFGRYALDKPGLVLANQGETIEDYLKQIPEPSFPADDDNVIPMLDGDWFTDDITERFREFLRIAFREEHYGENLRFVEQALGKDIRKYFLKDFYNDHVRRYKKRPIYWLFSSPKGSFNALIYMHRYQPHTVGTVLEYLRDFKDEKLKARKNHLEAVSISAGASQGDKTKALKEIEKINKILAELDDYERDVLYPLATEQVEIDLDDGVKANYPKFGDALKKIPGLS
ncbi:MULTISPECIES: BREX-1 system adenine-specific DNA-methyltransferase PglX [Gammaproteobacteria]|uniref:BREX-1 system adenine-specific DNA-methyltransferase PglX n=1 Tax=Gammaproteobacteria TaxID=1236 RepID=UPI00079B7EEE|nr:MULTISPECIES: BREX-1 system adenine-specific DNA-methyltransferase PglX [Gammaproteobacteria]KXJ42707.1 MAG: type II restriction endonuclease [Marinobacter sp. Hex_13]SEF51366.1 Type II restriction/modification system, DNA methylase subunit YeeA [Alcanivorax sp. DSM 26293]